MMRWTPPRIAPLLAAVALAACGGGGGSDPPPRNGAGSTTGSGTGSGAGATETVFNISAAAASWLQLQQSYARTSSTNSGTLDVLPLAAVAEPALSTQSLLRTQLRETAKTVSPAAATTVDNVKYYTTAPLVYTGSTLFGPSTTPFKAVVSTAMPLTAVTGSGGPLYSILASSSSSGGATAAEEASWRLDPDTVVGIAWLCQVFSLSIAQGTTRRTETSTYCSQINAAGRLLGFKFEHVTS